MSSLTSLDVKKCLGNDWNVKKIPKKTGQKEVFKVTNPKNESYIIKFVKIGTTKEINHKELKRVLREISIINKISSRCLPKPGIIKPKSYKKKNDIYYFFSEEYIDGQDLEDELISGKFPKSRCVHLLIDIITGIKDLWKTGNIIHRDIKPGNIIYDKNTNQYKLLDVGVSLVLTRSRITPTGHYPPLTLPYTSPEQIQKSKNIDFRSDLYSAGIVLFECVIGQHPYFKGGMPESSLIDKILHFTPNKLSKIKGLKQPAKLLIIIDRLLGKKMHQRYNNLDKLLIELKKI